MNRSGSSFNFFFGIPMILYSNWSSGNIYSLEKTDIVVDNVKMTAHYGIYSQEKKSRLFLTTNGRTSNFYGANYKMVDANNNVENGYFGHFTWSDHNQTSNSLILKDSMRDLIRITGLKNLLSFSVPMTPNLSYASILFSTIIDKDQTDNMMKAAQTQSLETWINQAKKGISDYFQTNTDPLSLCEWVATSSYQSNYGYPDKGVEAAKKNKSHCALTYEKGTILGDGVLKGIKKMHKELRNMAKYKNNNPKEFVAAYAKFGEAAITNAFTFNKTLQLAGSNVNLTYTVEGEKLSAYEIEVLTTGKAGEFKVIKSPGQPLKNSSDSKAYLENSKHSGVIIIPMLPILENPLLPSGNIH